MNDYKIVIDAGHGGSDPGSSGNGIVEKDLNLQIANYMYDRFKSLGVPVKIIRSTDETITPTERVQRVLDAYGNDPKVILISNHINAGGGEGAEVIYALRNDAILPNLILDNLRDAGQVTRRAYQRRLPSDNSKDYYFMQRNTGDVQSMTVEYGFLDNAKDAAKLKNNWRKYADAVVDAVSQYIGLSSSGRTYTVQSGDSLWNIAKRFNISVEELKAANSLNSNLLRIGQILSIPNQEESETGEYIVYTVKQGDTLSSIARKYNITVKELIDYNNLPSTTLSINQELLIPKQSAIPSNQNTYTVQSGDTLYNIAARFNTTVDNLMNTNNLSSSVLDIGQVLIVPDVEVDNQYIEYVVKNGDTLYSIANRYGTTVDEIKKLNNLLSNFLSIGEVLKLSSSDTNITYTVRSGDNLYSIAQRYNTTVDEIKRKNNLTGDQLSIGQILII